MRCLLIHPLVVTLAALQLLACGSDAQPEATPRVAAEPAPIEPVDEGPSRRLFVRKFVVPVRSAPREDSARIGYLRGGAVVESTSSRLHEGEGCRQGWYQLTTGGYVCNERMVTAFDGTRLPAARSRQPDLEAPLPYAYGAVRRRVPMYRRMPTDEDAAEFEGYVIPGVEVLPPEGAAVEGSTEPALAAAEPSPPAEAPAPSEASAPQTTGLETATEGEETEEEELTLATLQGDRHSALMRWLMPGFIVSLDKDFRRGPRRYWRTQSNGFVPYSSVGPRQGSTFQGTALQAPVEATEDPAALSLPMAWIVARNAGAYTRTDAGQIRRGGRAPRFHQGFAITEEATHRDELYVGTSSGLWLRDSDIRIARVPARPEGVGENEKWIDVDLSEQVIVAMQGDTPMYASLLSSGKADRGENPDGSWETHTGLFRVKSKHLTDTMDGDTAVDGPYSVDDVPYVMYFELAYALHSAFWHDGFGAPRSHGCVNLSPEDARWFFSFADPPLPQGWHSVYPTDDLPGTVINIHGVTPGHQDVP